MGASETHRKFECKFQPVVCASRIACPVGVYFLRMWPPAMHTAHLCHTHFLRTQPLDANNSTDKLHNGRAPTTYDSAFIPTWRISHRDKRNLNLMCLPRRHSSRLLTHTRSSSMILLVLCAFVCCSIHDLVFGIRKYLHICECFSNTTLKVFHRLEVNVFGTPIYYDSPCGLTSWKITGDAFSRINSIKTVIKGVNLA